MGEELRKAFTGEELSVNATIETVVGGDARTSCWRKKCSRLEVGICFRETCDWKLLRSVIWRSSLVDGKMLPVSVNNKCQKCRTLQILRSNKTECGESSIGNLDSQLVSPWVLKSHKLNPYYSMAINLHYLQINGH